jgi:hypothetical protein
MQSFFMNRRMLLVVPVLIGLAAPATAQRQQRQQRETPPTARVEAPEPKLILDREVFQYPGANRRNPFEALSRVARAGPQFADMSVRMIIHSPVADESIVVITDAGNRSNHRLRRGDVLGDATVLDIGRSRVVFLVNNLGVRQQHVLELRPNQPSFEPTTEPILAPPPPDTTSGGGSTSDPNTLQGA